MYKQKVLILPNRFYFPTITVDYEDITWTLDIPTEMGRYNILVFIHF